MSNKPADFYKAVHTIVGFKRDELAINGSHKPITVYKLLNGEYVKIQGEAQE